MIVAAAPARAVIALSDPDPRTAGSGIERLVSAGIEVEQGVLAEEAAAVTLGHILRVTEGRPAVTLKLAVGADGRLPRGKGTPVWITGPDARAHGHLLRAKHDAIMVGRGTVLADNPSLTCRLPGMTCRSPVRVVLDRRLRTPPEARLFDDLDGPGLADLRARTRSTPTPTRCRTAAPRSSAVPVDAHGMLGVRDALETLAGRGITRVLVEGGPQLARAFLDADLIDEAVIYQGAETCRTPMGSCLLSAKGLIP